MKKGVLNTLIVGLVLFIIGLVCYILFLSDSNEPMAFVGLNTNIITIRVGETRTLEALPTSLDSNDLIWLSEDSKIASVTSGVVKGNSVGETIVNLYLNGSEYSDRCIVKVVASSTVIVPEDSEPVVNPDPEDDPYIPPTDNPQEYIIKYYDANVIETGLNSVTLAGSEKVPVNESKVLNLSPNTLYVVSFDYKTVRGANTFNVDLYPEELPEINVKASLVGQRYDWEVSSNKSSMSNCKLRFFDGIEEASEYDIIISNILLGTVKTFTVKQNDFIGTMPTPTRSGYSFIGWYTKREGGERITESTRVTKNMILYPHWEEIMHVLPNEYRVSNDYTTITSSSYNSATLKYKTLKHKTEDKYYSLVWVKDAYHQLNSANNNLRGEQRKNLLNNEISRQNLRSKGMIATNGSFSISDRSNTVVIATRGSLVTNNLFSARYTYGTLTMGSDNVLKMYTSADATAMYNWLRSVGARNTWAITHFETSNWNGGNADGADYRTSLCQVDNHNFVLYVGKSSGIGDYMRDLHNMFGCKIAVNLDGGGSSGMYYKTKSMSSVGIIREYKRSNDCCRVVGDMLYFTE